MQKNRPHDELRLLSFSSSTFPLFSTLLLLFLLFLLQKMEKVQQFLSNKLGKSVKSAEIRKQNTTNHRRDQRWPTCEVPPSPFLCGQRMQSTLLPDSLLFVLSTSSCRPTVLCNNALSLQRLATLRYTWQVLAAMFSVRIQDLKNTWRYFFRPSRCFFRRFGSCTSQSCRHSSGVRLCPFESWSLLRAPEEGTCGKPHLRSLGAQGTQGKLQMLQISYRKC